MSPNTVLMKTKNIMEKNIMEKNITEKNITEKNTITVLKLKTIEVEEE